MTAKMATYTAPKRTAEPISINIALLAATGSRLAWWAAVSWFALGVESILRPVQANYRDLIWMLPFTLTALAFIYVHYVQRSDSLAERIGFYSVMIASTLVFSGNIGLLTDQPMLSVLAFPWGAVLWAVGLIVFGLGTWKAGKLPKYVALALILLEPGSILTGLVLSPIAPLHDRGGYSAGVEKGLALAFIAYGLRSYLRRSKASERPRHNL